MEKITCGVIPAQDHEVEAFKQVLKDYQIPLLVYQVVEYCFRQAMSIDPRDLNKGLDKKNWFGGYAYEKLPRDPALLKTNTFDSRITHIKKAVDKFNKSCSVGEFGFTVVGINKFNNLNKMYEDYHRMVKSLDKSKETKFLDKFEKFPNGHLLALRKTIQDMVKESAQYNDRVPGKRLVGFVANGEMVVSPKEYDYFIDYLTMSRLFWEPIINPSGSRRGDRGTGKSVFKFLAKKIRFDHLDNGVMSYDLSLKATKDITLDDAFFKKYFSDTKISKRIANANLYKTSKERRKYLEQHFLQDWFVEGLEYLMVDYQQWERKLAG